MNIMILTLENVELINSKEQNIIIIQVMEVLLKKNLLSTGKKSHVHGGYLPKYKAVLLIFIVQEGFQFF